MTTPPAIASGHGDQNDRGVGQLRVPGDHLDRDHADERGEQAEVHDQRARGSTSPTRTSNDHATSGGTATIATTNRIASNGVVSRVTNTLAFFDSTSSVGCTKATPVGGELEHRPRFAPPGTEPTRT